MRIEAGLRPIARPMLGAGSGVVLESGATLDRGG